MNKSDLLREAKQFRKAIEKAKDADEFAPKDFEPERMNEFPNDCCDDTADLFTHYLFHKFGIESIRVDSFFYDDVLEITRGHSWQEINDWVIDLTGDQFDNVPAILIKGPAVYVGRMGKFHQQFDIYRTEYSYGIECLGDGCKDRMYWLYDTIMKYLEE